jgi:hypothetical protein
VTPFLAAFPEPCIEEPTIDVTKLQLNIVEAKPRVAGLVEYRLPRPYASTEKMQTRSRSSQAAASYGSRALTGLVLHRAQYARELPTADFCIGT